MVHNRSIFSFAGDLLLRAHYLHIAGKGTVLLALSNSRFSHHSGGENLPHLFGLN